MNHFNLQEASSFIELKDVGSLTWESLTVSRAFVAREDVRMKEDIFTIRHQRFCRAELHLKLTNSINWICLRPKSNP